MGDRLELRPYRKTDFDAWLDLTNSARPIPITVQEARRREARRDPDAFERRIVTEFQGSVVGIGVVEHDFQLPPGWLNIHTVVRPDLHGRGIGRRIASELFASVPPGSAGLGAGVRDDDPASRAWVERRGFVQHAHIFLSHLDLDSFDPSRWRKLLVQLERDGIAIVDVLEQSDPEWRRLYDLVIDVMRDEPATGGDNQIDYPTFERTLVKGVEPVTFLVAVEGERWLGTSLMGKGAPDEGYTYLTGVRRHARGRGLAHALKIASLLRARDLGLARVGTNNDSRNTPMLAINKALGYRHGAGVMLYRKPL